MLHKNTLFGIIAAIVYAQSALGVASMQTASDTNQGGQASILSRAGSLRTSTTRTISTGPKASVSGTNETNSARLTSSAGGINAVGTKANKLTKSTAATGAALTELERRIDDLSATKADESYVKNYVDVYDRETVDSKLAGKIDRGTDFEQAFDARFGTKSIPSVTAVSNLDTRLATAEDKINTIEHNPGTDESTVNSLINSAVSNKKLVNEDYVSSAVDSAKGYADDKFATKTALNDYDTSAQTTAKIQAATEGLATTGYVTEQIGKIEIPEEANLSEYYKAQQVDALLANKLNNNALDNYDTSAETSGKIQAAVAGLASQTYASEQASNALETAQDYADGKIQTATAGLATTSYVDSQVANKITTTQLANALSQYDTSAETTEKIQAATSGLATQSALNNYYNKTEVDQKLVAASNGMSEEQVESMIGTAVNNAIGNNYYDKEETNTLLAAKADASSVYTKTQADATFATKEENATNLQAAKAYANEKFGQIEVPSLENYYDKEETDTLLAAKANASSVYTKTQADATFATKEENDAWNTAFMLMDEKISGKASVSDVYTKTQADSTFATKEENATNLQAANAYADTKVAGLATENFAIEKAAAAYDSAKDYADENFALKSALSAKADASTVSSLTSRVNTAEGDIETLQSGLANVYTKGEVDTKLTGISSGVGEEQVQQMINSAVASEVGNNYYTKTA
ncbi:MAG: hypothetical protein J5613_04020, partial [Alphaproteobacteria bacterium]|nr:hypothetical protein [Alphaproteobacteria bacterium]